MDAMPPKWGAAQPACDSERPLPTRSPAGSERKQPLAAAPEVSQAAARPSRAAGPAAAKVPALSLSQAFASAAANTSVAASPGRPSRAAGGKGAAAAASGASTPRAGLQRSQPSAAAARTPDAKRAPGSSAGMTPIDRWYKKMHQGEEEEEEEGVRMEVDVARVGVWVYVSPNCLPSCWAVWPRKAEESSTPALSCWEGRALTALPRHRCRARAFNLQPRLLLLLLLLSRCSTARWGWLLRLRTSTPPPPAARPWSAGRGRPPRPRPAPPLQRRQPLHLLTWRSSVRDFEPWSSRSGTRLVG